VTAPHVPLRSYYSTEAERSQWVGQIFDRTAGEYDRIERMLGLGSGSWYRHRALQRAGLVRGMSVVDVGTGTGLVAREAAAIVGDPALVLGVDPSPGMMANAKVPAGVRLLAGRAEAIPVADSSADFISMGYALRHVSDLAAAFTEYFRVLRPGGRVCLLEITSPEGTMSRALLKTYLRGVVPAAAVVICRRRDVGELMRYYWDTIEQCVRPATIMDALAAEGFTAIDRRVELGIFSEYRATKPA
jgi:demethylmenaquinone methyltransferase/2-methoxy-6-polyprenyl-1,4-benzoquinol methylase